MVIVGRTTTGRATAMSLHMNHLRLDSDLEAIFQTTIDDADILEMTSLKQVKALLQRYGATSLDGTDT